MFLKFLSHFGYPNRTSSWSIQLARFSKISTSSDPNKSPYSSPSPSPSPSLPTMSWRSSSMLTQSRFALLPPAVVVDGESCCPPLPFTDLVSKSFVLMHRWRSDPLRRETSKMCNCQQNHSGSGEISPRYLRGQDCSCIFCTDKWCALDPDLYDVFLQRQ